MSSARAPHDWLAIRLGPAAAPAQLDCTGHHPSRIARITSLFPHSSCVTVRAQFWVLGPGGRPPLGYIRTVAVHATDGRWVWDESGTPFDFEEAERYAARRLTVPQAQAVIAATILRHLYAVITTGQAWDPTIAAHGSEHARQVTIAA